MPGAHGCRDEVMGLRIGWRCTWWNQFHQEVLEVSARSVGVMEYKPGACSQTLCWLEESKPGGHPQCSGSPRSPQGPPSCPRQLSGWLWCAWSIWTGAWKPTVSSRREGSACALLEPYLWWGSQDPHAVVRIPWGTISPQGTCTCMTTSPGKTRNATAATESCASWRGRRESSLTQKGFRSAATPSKSFSPARRGYTTEWCKSCVPGSRWPSGLCTWWMWTSRTPGRRPPSGVPYLWAVPEQQADDMEDSLDQLLQAAEEKTGKSILHTVCFYWRSWLDLVPCSLRTCAWGFGFVCIFCENRFQLLFHELLFVWFLGIYHWGRDMSKKKHFFGSRGQGVIVMETVQTWAYVLGTWCTRSNSAPLWICEEVAVMACVLQMSKSKFFF